MICAEFPCSHCCAQQTSMHILVVEALLIIYLFYLGSELILIDIRKPYRSRTSLVRYSWSLSSCAFPAGSCPAVVYEPANHHRYAVCTQQSFIPSACLDR